MCKIALFFLSFHVSVVMSKSKADALYDALGTDIGRAKLGDDPLLQEKAIETMTNFLDEIPKSKPWSERKDVQILELPLGEIIRRTLQTAVDILNDFTRILTDRHYMSETSFRRKLFVTFTSPERRLYVGIWLILLAFILYFIDSAA